MRPVHRSYLTLFTLLTLVLCRAGIADESTPATSDIPALINALSDPDSAARRRAADRLLSIGMPARPQIMKAARSEDPEQRAQAAKILGQLPWWRPEDPEEARHLLVAYGQADTNARIAIIGRLDALNATTTLLRLFNEEPVDAVRWMIAFAWTERRDSASLKTLRNLKPPDDDAPALFLAGSVWMEIDRDKSMAFFRRAIDVDAAKPTNDSGVLSEAFHFLIAEAIESQDFERAAALLRQQVPRELTRRRTYPGSVRVFADSLDQLTALHDYFGPLSHYAWDVQTWSVRPERPSLLMSLCAALEPLGFTPPLPTGITGALRYQRQHVAVGRFLFLYKLYDPAEIELRRALVHTDRRSEMTDAEPLALLGLIAASRDDDAQAADLLERAFAFKGQNPLDLGEHLTEQDLRAEIYFRRAKVAQAAGNIPHADHAVDQILDFAPSNTDAVIKMIVWLKQTSRPTQAQTLFKRVYDQAKSEIADPANTSPTEYNDLAWLCARSGENLDEAVKFAQSAVDQAPNNSSFLDTLAEAKYRTGHTDEAIRLETRALQLTPDMTFMKDQIARFKAGKP